MASIHTSPGLIEALLLDRKTERGRGLVVSNAASHQHYQIARPDLLLPQRIVEGHRNAG
jgi:hypothetical protein